MNCLEKTDLVKYLKGELSQEQYQKIKKHIDDCEECAENLSALTGLMKLDHILDYEKKRGYAGECIPKFRLWQYVVGLVDDREITKHVFHCMNCKRNYFSYLERYESMQAVLEELKNRLVTEFAISIKEILKGFFLPLRSPALAPAVRSVVMRGETSPVFAVEEAITESLGKITDKDLAEEIIKEVAKEGFTRAACYEQLGLYQEALNGYEEFDPNNEDGIMLGRKIVLCRKLGKPAPEIMKLEERYKEIMGYKNNGNL